MRAVLILVAVAGCGPEAEHTPARSESLDPAVAADIVAFNQDAEGSASFRQRGLITRWELPVRVHIAPPVDRVNVEQALKYWSSTAAISFVIVDRDESPRILVREGTDGIAVVERGFGARSGIDGTFEDNRARSGFVVLNAVSAHCAPSDALCAYIHRHELGHALGYLDHNEIPRGLMSTAGNRSIELDARETAMMRALYALPHGARVHPDGTWTTSGVR